jgi:hypothetical protein
VEPYRAAGSVENQKGAYNEGVAIQRLASHEESSDETPTTLNHRGEEEATHLCQRKVSQHLIKKGRPLVKQQGMAGVGR